MASVEDIRRVLATVQEPLLNQDVVTLNMVKEITVDGAVVQLTIELTIPAYSHEEELKKRLTEALQKELSITDVQITFTSRVGRARPQTVQEGLAGVKHIIAVYACKGGVGKSTISTNLAVTLQKKGAKVGLLDADIHGPNIPLMMGVQDSPKGTGDNKLLPLEGHGVKLMSIGFLTNARLPSIWRGPMVHGAIQQLLRDTIWGELDYLIVDLPPGTGDAQLTIIQSAPVSGVVFVTTPQAVSLADGIKGIGLFRKMQVPVLGLVENMAGFHCPHCGENTDIFSKGGGEKEAKANGMPFLGSIPLEPAIVQGGDRGAPLALSHPDSEAAKAFVRVTEGVQASLKNVPSNQGEKATKRA